MTEINNINGYIFVENAINVNKEYNKIIVRGLLLPRDKISRNGVRYDWESVKKFFPKFVGKSFLYNHLNEGNDKPIGKVTAIKFFDKRPNIEGWDKIWDITAQKNDDEEQPGVYYEADINPKSSYADSILRGDIPNVSIQILAGAQENIKDDSGHVFTHAYVNDTLEISAVPTGGFAETTLEVALAEAFKKRKEQLNVVKKEEAIVGLGITSPNSILKVVGKEGVTMEDEERKEVLKVGDNVHSPSGYAKVIKINGNKVIVRSNDPVGDFEYDMKDVSKESVLKEGKQYLTVWVANKDTAEFEKFIGKYFTWDKVIRFGGGKVYYFDEQNPDALEREINKILPRMNMRFELEESLSRLDKLYEKVVLKEAKFKVGDRVLTKDGEVVTIISVKSDGEYNFKKDDGFKGFITDAHIVKKESLSSESLKEGIIKFKLIDDMNNIKTITLDTSTNKVMIPMKIDVKNMFRMTTNDLISSIQLEYEDNGVMGVKRFLKDNLKNTNYRVESLTKAARLHESVMRENKAADAIKKYYLAVKHDKLTDDIVDAVNKVLPTRVANDILQKAKTMSPFEIEKIIMMYSVGKEAWDPDQFPTHIWNKSQSMTVDEQDDFLNDYAKKHGIRQKQGIDTSNIPSQVKMDTDKEAALPTRNFDGKKYELEKDGMEKSDAHKFALDLETNGGKDCHVVPSGAKYAVYSRKENISNINKLFEKFKLEEIKMEYINKESYDKDMNKIVAILEKLKEEVDELKKDDEVKEEVDEKEVEKPVSVKEELEDEEKEESVDEEKEESVDEEEKKEEVVPQSPEAEETEEKPAPASPEPALTEEEKPEEVKEEMDEEKPEEVKEEMDEEEKEDEEPQPPVMEKLKSSDIKVESTFKKSEAFSKSIKSLLN